METRTKINIDEDGTIEVQQAEVYSKNGRNKLDRQTVYLDKKMVAKIIKLSNK